MIKLQGVSVQYKDIVDGIGDQLCDCLAEEWTEHMEWAIALPCKKRGCSGYAVKQGVTCKRMKAWVGLMMLPARVLRLQHCLETVED